MKFFPRLFVAALFCAAALPAFAWDETGHKITAYIAWERMVPAVRERVIRILSEAPEDSDLAVLYATYGSQSADVRKREFFAVASTWADIIRDRNVENRYRKYHKSVWHFDDTFWTVKDGMVVNVPKPAEGGQALTKIREFTEVLRSNASDAQKAIAIAWLEHLIGDIHQPLHTSARVTELEPKGDQGGNMFMLTPAGTPRENQTNLHWYWDNIVARNQPNTDSECDSAYIGPIARKIMSAHPYSRVQARLNLDDPSAWASESLKLAQTEVFSSELVRYKMPSDKYRKNAYRVAQQQLAIAGYRMGELFNRAFSAQ